MATKTTNYNLIKPDLTDDADIRVINGNMDVLDNQLKTVADSVTSGNKNAYTNISVSNDYTWKFTKGSGTNVSYDTIKNATDASTLSPSKSTYKVPTDSSKYGKLEYWLGTLPYKGSSTVTTDSGVLKFNHWESSNWNTAIVLNNNPSKRPYMMYQNGTAGEYSVFKELAWKDDVDTKLDKSGGNVTGDIYTTSSIFKKSNNGVLQLGGSTDGAHGARINLSGEKQRDAGLVKITADNGTNSNVFQINPVNGYYNFNGMSTYLNSPSDVFVIGDNNQPRLALNKDGVLRLAQANSNVYYPIPWRKTHLSFSGTQVKNESHEGYIKFDDGLLIQWGCVNAQGTSVWNKTQNLPLPYENTGYVAMITLAQPTNGHTINADNRDVVYIQSESAIGVWSDNNKVIYWMTIGKGVI